MKELTISFSVDLVFEVPDLIAEGSLTCMFLQGGLKNPSNINQHSKIVTFMAFHGVKGFSIMVICVFIHPDDSVSQCQQIFDFLKQRRPDLANTLIGRHSMYIEEMVLPCYGLMIEKYLSEDVAM